MERIGVGIVGLDHWYTALPLLEGLQRHTEAHAVALWHRLPERAQEISRRFGVPLAQSADAVIDDAEARVICILTSTDENAALARRALDAGRAVIAIKPMAMSLAEADEVVAAVQRASAIYFPTEGARRLQPVYRRIKEWIDAGRIGRPLQGRFFFHAPLPQGWPGDRDPGWWADPARTPGGGFLDHAVYHVDLARWFFGSEPVEIGGMAANLRHPHATLRLEDYGQAAVRLASGAMIAIEDSWTAENGTAREGLEIRGEHGVIVLDGATGRLTVNGRFGEMIEGWAELAVPPGRADIVGHVVRCLRGEEQPVATVHDARANLATCFAFYEAARGQHVVRIEASR
jgi:predicted dehydrogenase